MSIPSIPQYKVDFLECCLSANVITFGTYKLKSGRTSPYFFNAGLFLDNASVFRSVQAAYAQCIADYATKHPEFTFDAVFGVSLPVSHVLRLRV